MKFFKRPPLQTVRRRFLWWPKKVVYVEYGYHPIPGAEKVKFYPGWYDQGPGGFTVPSHSFAAANWPPRNVKPEHCGGMVVPVQHELKKTIDAWVWLEYVLEELQMTSLGDRSYSKWWPTAHRKQWNLWHEYY
jgi:hypothetical protein